LSNGDTKTLELIMAHGLSMLFEVKDTGPATSLVEAFGAGGGGPDILHYVWVVPMPTPNPKPGISTLLLTTVYDEEFAPYIRDLVLANPAPFNVAAAVIVGLEGLIPVESPENLPKFIDFVRDHDLTKGGTTPFTESYPYTVVQIKAALG
jgi:hypothetical protein